MIKKLKGSELLYGGSDQKLVYTSKHRISVSGETYEFKFSDLVTFHSLFERYSKELIKDIMEDLKMKKNDFGIFTREGLESYVLIKGNLIFVFGIGETQPTLFKIIQNAIYQIHD